MNDSALAKVGYKRTIPETVPEFNLAPREFPSIKFYQPWQERTSRANP